MIITTHYSLQKSIFYFSQSKNMKKEYIEVFIKSLQKGKYTIQELYEIFKDFCAENVIPCTSIGLFRQNIEPVLLENNHSIYYTNQIKINYIIIK